MTDKKISELPSITGANFATSDLIPVVDVSTNTTSKITKNEFFSNVTNITVTNQSTLAGSNIRPYASGGDPDISGLVPGSTAGVVVEGPNSQHLVVGLRENDVGDSFSIISGGGNFSSDNTYDTIIANFRSDGKVGIGTSSPSEKLHVNGTGQKVLVTPVLYGANQDHAYLIASATNYDGTTTNWGTYGFHHRLKVNASGTPRVTIDTSGGEAFCVTYGKNIGIGTSSPASTLTVNNATKSEIRIDTTGGANSDSELAFFENGVDRASFYWDGVDNDLYLETTTGDFCMLPAGNVGIGTATPRSRVHVYGDGQTTANITDAGNQGAFLRVSDTGTSVGSGGGVIFGSLQSDDTGAVGFAAIKGLLQNGLDNTIGQLAFSTRNSTTDTALTERMRITQGGQVGIGTTTPSATLDVVGTTELNGSVTANGNVIVSGTAQIGRPTDHWSNGDYYDVGGSGGLWSQGSYAVDLVSNGYRNSSGTWSSLSSVTGASGASNIRLYPTGAIYFGTDATKADGSSTNPTTRMTLNDTGLGIGTSSPSSQLHLHTNSTSNVLQLTNSATGAGAGDGMQIVTSNTEMQLRNREAGPTTFYTSNTERMRIDSSGNLLVGTTVSTSVSSDIGAVIYDGGYIARRNGIMGYWNFIGVTGSHTVHSFMADSTTVGSISVTASATAYNTSSDYRLKEDVQPMVGASDRVLSLNPVNFAWKADGSRTDGFIAHEVQEVAPYAVTGVKDGEDMQAMDHSKLVPLLTAALQEALTEIAALKARLAAANL